MPAARDGAVELTDQDIARIQSLGERSAGACSTGWPPPQREAVEAHVIDERGYGEIAQELQTSEAVVRKRVSRGLATARQRMGRRR